MNIHVTHAALDLFREALEARERGVRGVRVDYIGHTDSIYVSVTEGQRTPILNRQIRLRPSGSAIADLSSVREQIGDLRGTEAQA